MHAREKSDILFAMIFPEWITSPKKVPERISKGRFPVGRKTDVETDSRFRKGLAQTLNKQFLEQGKSSSLIREWKRQSSPAHDADLDFLGFPQA